MARKKHIVAEAEQPPQPQDHPTSDVDLENADDMPTENAERIQELEEKLAAAKSEADAKHDRMLRMAAELENYRKRSARELDDLKKFATENLLRELLSVVDNLERAIASVAVEDRAEQPLVDGVCLTLAEIAKILENHHVRPVQAMGKPFDPAFHQAMCQEPSADHPPNTVIQEFQKGYLIHDRLLRPAMVVVSTAVPNGEPGEPSVDTHA